MKRNPIYSREMRASSRSLRLPVILLIFNGILCLATLLNMYSVVTQARTNASIQYSSFIEMYQFVTTIEFILLLFIVPAITAPGISGERERQTLELMLTTQMTAAQVVWGKLISALSTMLLLIVSSFPAIAMVFVYGGITWTDVCSLLLCYIASAVFAGSIGTFFSAVFKRSTLSTVATYGVLIVVLAGTYFLNQFALSLASMNLNRSGAMLLYEEAGVKPSSGGIFYLFLLNPAVTFSGILTKQTGSRGPMSKMCDDFGMELSGFVMENWIFVSIALQLVLALLLILGAIYCVEPVKSRYKNRKSHRTAEQS